MMTKAFVPAAMLAVALAGCGGGDTISGTASAPSAAQNQPPLARSAQGLALVGNSLDLEAGDLRRENVLSGEIDGSNGVTMTLTAVPHNAATGASMVVIDPDGLGANGELSDNAGKTLATFGGAAGVSNAWSFTRSVNGSGAADWGVGVYGFRSDPSSVATTGTATYTGTGRLFEMGAIGPVATADTTSQVDVNFASGGVDLTVTASGGQSVAGVSQVQFNGMAIKGASFSTQTAQDGGTLPILTSGNTLGTIGRANARGRFYGATDSAGIPDEVGGVFFVDGASGSIAGTFLGD